MKHVLISLCLFMAALLPATAQEHVFTSRVMDAEMLDVLPYVQIRVSPTRGTLSNSEGYFSIITRPDDTLTISHIGFETVAFKASELPSVIHLQPQSTTLGTVTVSQDVTTESILDKVMKKLEQEQKRGKKLKRRYFARITETLGKREEMMETFIEARSTVALQDLSIIGGKRGGTGEGQDTLLYNTNLHFMFQPGPLGNRSNFWRRTWSPLQKNNYKRIYRCSHQLHYPKTGSPYYIIKLEADTLVWKNKSVVRGTFFVDANTYGLLRFEGTVPFVSMSVDSDFRDAASHKMDNQFCVTYSHDRGTTEVADITYTLQGNNIQAEGLLTAADHIDLEKIRLAHKPRKIKKNLVQSIDRYAMDSLMWANHDVVRRTEREKRLAALHGKTPQQGRLTPVYDTAAVNRTPFRKPLERLHAFGRLIPQEKVYIHMDNTSYFQGDTIWFSAYTRQTSTGTPSQMSGVLYVELLNQEGYLAERKLIEMRDGRGDGYFVLDYPVMYSGFYELRAYTRWQLNWGMYEHKHSKLAKEWFLTPTLEQEYYRDYEKLYSRVFPVYDRPADPEDPERSMTTRTMRRRFRNEADIDKRKRTLTFFPEGGELLTGVPCRVAFEATWDDGEWLEGTLEADGQTATAVHRGRGVFTVTPEPGKRLEAVFNCSDGKTIRERLPRPREEGAALHVARNGEEWRIEVALSQGVHPDSVGLTLMHEGRLMHFRPMTGRENTFTFRAEELQTGVNQATVFDTRGGVLADRLFFVTDKSTEEPTLVVHTEKNTFTPYEPIHLSIESQAEDTPISLAVRDGNQTEDLHDNGDIRTEMLLSSEVRGFIPDPGWYFEKDDDTHRQALDLLMMTQGWRRFEWKNMALKSGWDFTHPVERAPIIMGSVFKLDVESMEEDWQEMREEMEKERRKIEKAPESPLRATDEAQKASREANRSELEKASEEAEKRRQQEEQQTAQDRTDAWENLKQQYGMHTNLKREVKVHAELVHPWEDEPALAETDTRKGLFRIDLPRFYGFGKFFLSAADTTTWKPGEKYNWIHILGTGDDLPAATPLTPRAKETSDYFVRVASPYPNFVKKYDFHQCHLAGRTDPGTLDGTDWETDEDGSTRMSEVKVKERRPRGLRRVDVTQPAFMIDAYEAKNRRLDAGMLFAQTSRVFVGDYGLDYPYVNSLGGSTREYRVEDNDLFSKDSLTRAMENIVIPEDSMYYAKYLRMYPPGSNQGHSPTYMEGAVRITSAISKYVLYSDYSPRLEGSNRYVGSNLPETNLGHIPFPHEAHRAVYRDRCYTLPGFAYPAAFYSPDYSKQTPPDSVKDYRRTLYWNPNLMLDREGKASITLYNNARTTQIQVEAAGQAADGTLLWNKE